MIPHQWFSASCFLEILRGCHPRPWPDEPPQAGCLTPLPGICSNQIPKPQARPGSPPPLPGRTADPSPQLTPGACTITAPCPFDPKMNTLPCCTGKKSGKTFTAQNILRFCTLVPGPVFVQFSCAFQGTVTPTWPPWGISAGGILCGGVYGPAAPQAGEVPGGWPHCRGCGSPAVWAMRQWLQKGEGFTPFIIIRTFSAEREGAAPDGVHCCNHSVWDLCWRTCLWDPCC